MRTQRSEGRFVLRLEAGEEIKTSLLELAEREGIEGGHVTALGGVRSVRLKYFDAERNAYDEQELDEQLELLSLTGTLARKDGRAVAHLHGVFGDRQLRTRGGHIARAIVRPTCEVVVTPLGALRREKDQRTGLDLLEPAGTS